MPTTNTIHATQVSTDRLHPELRHANTIVRKQRTSPRLVSVWIACLFSGLLLSSVAAWRSYQAPIGSGTDRALRTEVLAAAVGLCLGLSWVFILLIPIRIASTTASNSKATTQLPRPEPANPLDSPSKTDPLGLH